MSLITTKNKQHGTLFQTEFIRGPEMGHGAQEGEDNTENCHKAAEMVIAEK